MNKEVRCSGCKRKFPKDKLIKHHSGGILCEDCYPYYRLPNGRLIKKVPQWFNP